MKRNGIGLVYYTVYFTKDGLPYQSILDQLIRSVESLRRHNHSSPILLAVWGGKLRAKDRQQVESLDVEIRDSGSYEKRLQSNLPPAWAHIFSRYPSGPRWLGLEDILTTPFDRVLYVDNDTFIMGDIEHLFQRYQAADVYAREEPASKRSHKAYDSTYVDESVMRNLQRSEKINRIIPFNTGVVLMKRQVAKWLSENLDLFFGYLIRFTTWLVQNPSDIYDEPFLIAAREMPVANAITGLEPLRYPSSSQWIVEQFALWFTLAASTFKVRLFPLSAILQGDEFLLIGNGCEVPCLVHYYSANVDYFFNRWFPHLKQAGFKSKHAVSVC